MPSHMLYSTIRHPITPTFVFLGVSGYPNLTATARHKLAPRSTACVFLCYPSSHKGYRCLDLSTQCIIISHHVVFDETCFPFGIHNSGSSPSDLDFLLAGTVPTRLPAAAPSHANAERPRPFRWSWRSCWTTPRFFSTGLWWLLPLLHQRPLQLHRLGIPPDVQSASLGLYDSATNPAACTTASGRAAYTTTARAACSDAGRAGSYTSTCATGLLDGHPVTDWHSSSGPTLRLLRHPLCRLAGTGKLLERLGRPTVEGCHG
jgi:hypothetical protein